MRPNKGKYIIISGSNDLSKHAYRNYLKVENFLGWELSFDGEHSLSNHSPISHWGLKDGST